MRFRSKERGTRVKDCTKNGASKRAGRGGEERKETFPSLSPFFHFLALVSFLTRPKPVFLCSETKRKRLLRRLRSESWWDSFLLIKMEKKKNNILTDFYFQGKSNGPFSSCLKPQFQCEAKCETIDVKIFFYSHSNKTHLHKKGFALSLVLKVRVLGTREWPSTINLAYFR